MNDVAYTTFVPWAFFALIVYPFGVPLLYSAWLWLRRGILRKRDGSDGKLLPGELRKLAPMRTLFVDMRPGAWGFEIANLMRQLLVNSVLLHL